MPRSPSVDGLTFLAAVALLNPPVSPSTKATPFFVSLLDSRLRVTPLLSVRLSWESVDDVGPVVIARRLHRLQGFILTRLSFPPTSQTSQSQYFK